MPDNPAEQDTSGNRQPFDAQALAAMLQHNPQALAALQGMPPALQQIFLANSSAAMSIPSDSTAPPPASSVAAAAVDGSNQFHGPTDIQATGAVYDFSSSSTQMGSVLLNNPIFFQGALPKSRFAASAPGLSTSMGLPAMMQMQAMLRRTLSK